MLILSAPRSYDGHAFVHYAAVLWCASTVHIIGGYLLATAAVRLLPVPPAERAFVQLMVAFGNNATLPFLIVTAICDTWKHTRDDPTAPARAYGMIIIYGTPWTLLFFTLGRWSMERAARHETRLAGAQAQSDAPEVMGPGPSQQGTRATRARTACLQRALRAAHRFAAETPSVPAELLAIAIACIEPLRQALYFGPLDSFGRVARLVGQPTISVGALVTGGALYTSFATEGFGTLRGRWKVVWLVIGLKLVLLPLVFYPLTYGAMRRGWLTSRDPLLLFVVLLQCAVPSAQFVVSLAQLSLSERSTGRLASLYLPLYLCSWATMTVAVGAALWLVDGLLDAPSSSPPDLVS